MVSVTGFAVSGMADGSGQGVKDTSNSHDITTATHIVVVIIIVAEEQTMSLFRA